MRTNSKTCYLQFLIFFVFLFTFFNSQSQSKDIGRKINWNYCNLPYFINDTTYYQNGLCFENNIINISEYGLLPIYYEEFPVVNNLSDIEIKNLIFKNLNFEELNCISDDISKINNNKISVENKILYHKKQPFISLMFLPFRINYETGKIEKLVSFDICFNYNSEKNILTNSKVKNYAANSVLSTGNWYKIAVNTSGIYKLTYEELIQAGVSLPVVSENIRLFGNGGSMLSEKNNDFRYDDLVENAIVVEDGGDASFDPGDYILFYGEGTTVYNYDTVNNKFTHNKHLYSDFNYYFLTVNNGKGKRIQIEPSNTLPVTDYVNTFTDYAVHNNDSLNLIKSGKIWYGEKFDILTSYSFSFHFPDITYGSLAKLVVDVAASSPYNSTFTINADGNISYITAMAVAQGYNSDYAKPATAYVNFIPDNDIININISYNKPTNTSIAWLNYIELNVTRNLHLNGGQMRFRNIESIGKGKISEFTITGASTAVKVWNITDPVNIKLVEGDLSGNKFKFRTSTDSLKEFIVYNGTSFYSVSSIVSIPNQNLHGLEQYNMVIVTWPGYISEALRLANYHIVKDGIKVLVVFPDNIYNEFSSGKQDISAIRDFMKMFYDRAVNEAEMPEYLLLFGDGSYDPKSRISGNTNQIPCFQSLNSLQPIVSYVSDDFFGLLDDGEGYECNGSLDIGIGRLPVQTLEEASAMVDKIIRYSENNGVANAGNGCSSFVSNIPVLADWRNIITFIADDEDNNLHLKQAETLADIVEDSSKLINIEKIYLDAYQQLSFSGGQRYPDVNDAINKRVERGALFINYTGHGGEVGWAHERILEISDINKWNNYYNMPVFVTATCEFSRFDDPVRTSAGELVILNKNGGGIALFTTTRLAFSNSNFNLNKSFYQNLFSKKNGKHLKMGDIIRLSKVANGSNINIRNFVLLGDPALNIAFPEYNVVTTYVPDTIKALSMVNITGYIADETGNKINNFNGKINITVFDKKSSTKTLGNDIGSYPVSFSVRCNIIYKGKTVVENGEFSFSFVVPKDISYKFDKGKISYYAENGYIDAAGYYDDFIIGGANQNAPQDYTGPDIRMFMNDTLFISGGITNENPVLLALVSDSNGINTVGNGIGHDIIAVLDGNTGKSYVLNDYYESDLNTYKSGIIRFPLSNLSEGYHTLMLKVWDVYNNSAEANIDFVVSHSENLVIAKVINYPNPFSDYTFFVFEHNSPCCDLNVKIQIYTITGQLFKTISTNIATDGYKTMPLVWDGSGDGGLLPNNGFYIYRLTVKDEKDGDIQIITGKLLRIK